MFTRIHRMSFPSLFHPVLTHRRRSDLHLDYPSDTFDMVRLSYYSLNLAESEVSTTARAYSNVS
jgi:hypothetical protein